MSQGAPGRPLMASRDVGFRRVACALIALGLTFSACSDEPEPTPKADMSANNVTDMNVADDGPIPDMAPDEDMRDQGHVDPLSVVSTTPMSGAAQVELDAAIEVVFSEPISLESVTATSVTSAPALELEPSLNERTLTLKPKAPLTAETDYVITLTTSILTEDGQKALSAPFNLSFKTRPAQVMPVDPTDTYTSGQDTARVTIQDKDTATRTYTMQTTAPLRDNQPSDKMLTFKELPEQPIVRSGHDVFDALFALSIHEARQDSVSSIKDGAFNQGQGVACECFETGEKWNYVWTRDTAYAVDLGLPYVDPARAVRSLQFKLSQKKAAVGGGQLQIVQDTGSGGSYPVSTDRVVWAIGAWEALHHLEGSARSSFAAQMLDAFEHTIEQDRKIVYDPQDGLYRGEQSFLDWREQSYPAWTREDTVHLGMSKALSTNVGHYAILDVASKLADAANNVQLAQRYRAWADALAQAIRDELWLNDAKQLSTLKTTALDPAPLHKFDLLGTSLAVLWGVIDGAQAQEAVASYPHTLMGPPVLWPQQPLIPIYHNRGIWPFVTAYGLLAARKVGNVEVFEHDMASLIRGAALNLSNMENFEFLTQRAFVEDGAYSGPVVNSRRQLWSVAGYMGAVIKGVFGVETGEQGVRVMPFVTSGLHREYFKSGSLSLSGLKFHGKILNVRVDLPAEAAAAGQAYEVVSATLNGQSVAPDAFIQAAALQSTNAWVIKLGVAKPSNGTLKVIQGQDFKLYWSPKDPNLSPVELENGKLKLTFDGAGEDGITFNIYRDGQLVASDLSGPTWTDTVTDFDQRTYCYSVESVFTSSKNRSHHAQPQCYWGGARIQSLSAFDLMAGPAGQWSRMHNQPHYSGWGGVHDELDVAYFKPAWSGSYGVQAVYSNGAGSINTGITAALKRLVIEEIGAPAATPAQEGYLLMPHLASWDRWAESSIWPVSLSADKLYRVRLVDAINMSHFEHFVPYTGGLGGGQDVYNFVNITSLKFLPTQGQPAARSNGDLVPFDGASDFDKFTPAQQLTTGAPIQPWSRFAMTWDQDYLYVAIVSAAFEQPYVPYVLYLETDRGSGALPTAQPSQGIEYSNLTPALPFSPNFMITTRERSEDGSAAGPWAGVWRKDAQGNSFSQIKRFAFGQDLWIAADKHTMSLRIPRHLLGGATKLRLAGHAVGASQATPWTELVPSTHSPASPSAAGYYELDLSGQPATSAWVLK